MNARMRWWAGMLVAGLCLGNVAAQIPPLPTGGKDTDKKVEPPPVISGGKDLDKKIDPPPRADVVAVKVNGQAIPELAVYRGLMRVPPEYRDKERKEVIKFLVDNVVIDQYLVQLGIKVDPKEVDAQFTKLKAEASKDGNSLEETMKKLLLTETDIRKELESGLRWDQFVMKQGSDAVLKDIFDKNPDMFNGASIRARHILVEAGETGKAKAAGIKKAIEDDVAGVLGKLPATTDAAAKEKERMTVLEKSFADAAGKHSTCPSSKRGGDLDFFPRIGQMVEPFARAAFALKLYQLGDPVETEFGWHLILTVEHKPGRAGVKFDDVKPIVQSVYADRLRDAVLTQYRPKAKIEGGEKK